MTRPLRVGVAGLGFGAAVHAPVLAALPGVEVVAIAGSTRERAGAVAERLGIPHACGGLDALFSCDLDAVSLALPPADNERALDLAIHRRLAILSEKPIAASAATAARLAERAAGLTTAVDFQFMELDCFRALGSLLAKAGPVDAAHLTWTVQSYAHRNRLWGWKTDRDRGGGVLTTLGSHFFFLAEWLLGPLAGGRATLSSAVTATFCPPGCRPAEDRVEYAAGLTGGGVLTALLSNGDEVPPLHRWDIRCGGDHIVLENPSSDYMSNFTLSLNGREVASDRTGGEEGRTRAFRALAARFADGARAGRSITPDLTAGARVQAHLELARGESRPS